MSMTNDLKQRLVGAAVITAIAAIFLPMLFDDPVQETGKLANKVVIPTPPEVTEPDNTVSTSAPKLAYPAEMATEQTEEMLEQPTVETPINPSAAKMTAKELAALKDKKEREKILKGA